MTGDERRGVGYTVWAARLALAAAVTIGALWVARPWLTNDHDAPEIGRWSGAGQPAPSADGARGLYVVHPDPRVGYVSRPDATYAIHDGVVHTDDLGLRVRPGPPPPPSGEALDVVVLGDSIAFGFGLHDDETLAHRLEQLLSERLARPVVCRTVATPGWNQRNSIAFLRDHADRLPADIVIAIPVGNDLLDTDGVLTSGLRRWAPDPFAPHPLVPIYQGLTHPLRNRPRGVSFRELVERAGPAAISADVSPSSTARYDDNAALLLEFEAWLEARGGRLVVMPYGGSDYGAHLARRLLEAGTRAPIVPLGYAAKREHQLPDDPHPNAVTTATFALVAARTLARAGLAGDLTTADLPADPPGAAEVTTPTRSDDEWRAAASAARRASRSALSASVDLDTFEGVRQLIGGVNPDGTLQSGLIVLLGGAGAVLEVELAPIERDDLLPLVVDVHAGDELVGHVTLAAPGEPVVERFAIPATDAPLEVRLAPRAWIVRETADVRHLASCRLVRVARLR